MKENENWLIFLMHSMNNYSNDIDLKKRKITDKEQIIYLMFFNIKSIDISNILIDWMHENKILSI